MKITFLTTSLFLAMLVNANSADAPTLKDQQLILAVKEVQMQQAAIAENQAKMDAKIATIMESVRTARIFSSRSGH